MADKDGTLESLFLDENYVQQRIRVGPYEIPVLSLQCSSTDYDLTGQIIWPGAELMNDYIVKNSEVFRGASVIELGSGVGLTGLLCAHIGCSNVVMTDHNDTVLKVMRKNMGLQPSASPISCEKLEWGNEEQLSLVLEKHPKGFDFIIGADICYQQCNIPPLLKTAAKLLTDQQRHCTFFLAYISRIKSTDLVFLNEASKNNLELIEITESRTRPRNGIYSGVIYRISLKNS